MAALSPTAILLLIAAPFVGSFLGVLVRRLPRDEPVVLSRSRCEDCAHPLGPVDLVPLFSFAALRGRCRFCTRSISPFHPLIELGALGIAVSAVAVDPSDGGWLVCSCVLGWTLLALAWIDADWMILPDMLTLPLVLLGLAATWLLDPEAIGDHALGAAVGWFAFTGLAAGYRAVRKRDGLGQGDAKLLAASGAWVGWQALPDLVLAAAVLGILGSLVINITRKRWARWRRKWRAAHPDRVYPPRRRAWPVALAFGPYLAIATWAIWLVLAVAS